MNLFISLKSSVDNIEKNYNQFVDLIVKIADSYKSFKEAVTAILENENRLTYKDVYVAYNIGKRKLIPQAKSIVAFGTVKFLCEEAPIKQQEKMLKAGVLVCSRKHPAGHLVSLYELKHCQIRYAWNYQKSRPMTKSERLEFSRQEFAPTLPEIEIKKPVTSGKLTGKVSKNPDGTYSFTGSFLAGDIDAWLQHLGDQPMTGAIDPCSILAGVYAKDWTQKNIVTHAFNDDDKHTLTVDPATRQARIVLRGNYSVSELFVYVYDACVYEMCWKMFESFPRVFNRIFNANKFDQGYWLNVFDREQTMPITRGKEYEHKVSKDGKKLKTKGMKAEKPKADAIKKAVKAAKKAEKAKNAKMKAKSKAAKTNKSKK